MSEKSELWQFNIENAAHTMEQAETTLPNLMDEVHQVGILSAETGPVFSSLFVNRHAINDAPLIVMPGQFLADVTGPERQYEAFQFAHAFPDNPILLVDTLGHGHSDKHTLAQFAQMAKDGSADPVADPMAEAIRAFRTERDAEDQPIQFIGISYGARLGIALARKFPEETTSLTLFETPSLTDRWTAGLQKDYAFKESRQWAEYERHIVEHTPLRDNYAGFIEQGDYRSRAKNFYLSGDMAAFANLIRSPLAHPGAMRDLEALITQQRDIDILMCSGSRSSISKAADARPYLERVAELAPLRGHRFESRIYPEDDHNMGRAELMPRLASIAVAHVNPDWYKKVA